MQHATEATVLADFNNAEFEYAGTTSTFFKRDGKFYVNTDGADGKLADFEISHVFGLYPLQQYLIAFPDGRMQALSIAWDARPTEEGGQRWYHLYPNERITRGDPLHWTRSSQNWNWMCADCHTTNLDRNYDAASNTYATTWSEMNVACEACHGPGRDHVAWARREPGSEKFAQGHGLVVALDERKGVKWVPVPTTGNAARSVQLASRRELGVCAQCHSRRAPFAKGMDHDGRLLETHDISLLSEGLYFADGQQLDEVYNVGSFLQSKMHAAGVTCSDCHDPHSGKPRAAGNAVCAQCHLPGEIRCADAYAAPGRLGWRAVRGLPHADPELHGHRCPARSFLPGPAAGLERASSIRRCVHRLPQGPRRRLGCGGDREGLRSAAQGLPDLRARAARGSHWRARAPPEKLVALASDPRRPAIARATAIAGLASLT